MSHGGDSRGQLGDGQLWTWVVLGVRLYSVTTSAEPLTEPNVTAIPRSATQRHPSRNHDIEASASYQR
jgi:hypothetical protein